MARRAVGYSPAATGASIPYIPGAPVQVLSMSDAIPVAAGANELQFTSDEGGPSTVSVAAGLYTPGELVQALEDALNADDTLTGTGTITFAARRDGVTERAVIDAGVGHTLALSGVGGASTGAALFGFAADKSARQEMESDEAVRSSGVIVFDIDDSDNPDYIEFAIYVTVGGVGRGYLDEDGADNGATAVWQVVADWAGGGQAGRVIMTGLETGVACTVKIKARSETEGETAFGEESAEMYPLAAIDYGPLSERLTREITTGDARIVIDGVTDADGEACTLAVAGSYGDITVTYSLAHPAGTPCRIVPEFSENGIDWSAATSGTGGDGITDLATSVTEGEGEEAVTTIEPVEHTWVWDSYTDAGLSERDTTVYLRLTPYDDAESGGDPGAIRTSDAFEVNNRPSQVTLENADESDWGKDATPVFAAVMGDVRGGTALHFRLSAYDSAGVLAYQSESAIDPTGWEYETEPDVWEQVALGGVPVEFTDGTNRVRHAVQSALDAANDEPYEIYIEQGELSDR
jgi:hypothetical protein